MVIKGVVVAGRSLGHKLGFPTANIIIDNLELSLENGVYSSRATIGAQSYRAISNLGTKPTVDGHRRGLECHIFDFNDDIYGQQIEVELQEKIRDELRFESLEALQAQIALDVERVKNL